VPALSDEQPLRFGRFEIRPAERALRADGRPVGVGARAFDLLLALARRRDRLVTKQELLDVVWPGVIVEEHNIAAQISSLRKLLGAGVIATVPGRGYRFTAALDAAPREDEPRRRHDHLPEPRTRFIGRQAELGEIEQLFAATRLLTLTGIGGCGKTRLALQFAQRRRAEAAGGVYFVDLAPLEQPDRVAAACALALGIGEAGAVSPTERVVAHLADRQALIVLDNCEHVRAPAAALVDALLAHPGRTRIVATSREPLGVPGEQLYAVRSLSLPATPALHDVRAADAVRVFVDRARLVLPGFEVDAGNAAAVAEVCRRLDGIALAIEMAAARVAMLSVSDIAARLDDRFRLLTRAGAGVARQQTLLAAMQWSHDLLAPAEQRMLRRLAVFAGGFSLEAAAAIGATADEHEALALLTVLHDKSLLDVERSAERPRYRMLETVRQYAQQRLDASGETVAARERHVEHSLALAEAAAAQVRGAQQSAWLARLREEHENLVAALAWCGRAQASVDPQHGLRLAAATARYWLYNEVQLGCSLARAVLQRDAAGADSPARCETLLVLAMLESHRGHGDEGLPHAREGLAMALRLGSVEWQATALNSIGLCLSDIDEPASLRHFERARDLAAANGCKAPLDAALNNIAMADFGAGRLDAAEQGLRRALELTRARGDIRAALLSLHNLVRVLVVAGEADAAQACAVESEALLRGVGEDLPKLELLEVAAGLAALRGEHALAARLWGATGRRIVDAGYGRYAEDEAYVERMSGRARQALGDEAYAQAEASGRSLDVPSAMLELRRWLGSGA
jgi:predicted ATPase/DNA-binding winged helix-turn-helix (wHTH) protein